MEILLRKILNNKKAGFLFCFLCVILFEGLHFGDGTRGNYKIDLQADNSIPSFKVAYSSSVFRNVNLTDAEAASKIFVQELIKQNKTNYKSEALIIDDLINNIDYIKNQELDVITMTGIEFLAVQKKVKLYPFAAPVLSDSCLNKIIILVRKDSKINSVADLKNKIIKIETAVQTDHSSILDIWLKVQFYKNKISFDKVFNSQESLLDPPLKTITSVFFKKADAAVVVEDDYKTVVELNPQLGEELKVLTASKPLLLAVTCYTEKEKKSKDLELLKSAVYKLHESASGKNFIKIFKMKRLLPFKNDFLVNVNELFNEYESIQRSKKITNK
jgi:ABC-type phosphate/phosphonate transport system substrate-binding protein